MGETNADKEPVAPGVADKPCEKSISGPEGLVLSLLGLIECSSGKSATGIQCFQYLKFFLSRGGGMHLLLLLLNAHYFKRPAGRMPGWTFGALMERMKLSERSLRMLLSDGMDCQAIFQVNGRRDKRCHVYCLNREVINEWEALTRSLSSDLPETLNESTPGQLADIDFGKWWLDMSRVN